MIRFFDAKAEKLGSIVVKETEGEYLVGEWISPAQLFELQKQNNQF